MNRIKQFWVNLRASFWFLPSLIVIGSIVPALLLVELDSIGGIGTLIFFIHHIADSIQASSILATVAEETITAVDRLFPEKLGKEPFEPAKDQPVPERMWRVIPAPKSGYIQSVDHAALLRLARESGTIVRMERRIGEFVIDGTPLVSVALENSPGNEVLAEMQAAYQINRNRTVGQDAAFGIGQILNMVWRACVRGKFHRRTTMTKRAN